MFYISIIKFRDKTIFFILLIFIPFAHAWLTKNEMKIYLSIKVVKKIT